jgi:hypothetical protein
MEVSDFPLGNSENNVSMMADDLKLQALTARLSKKTEQRERQSVKKRFQTSRWARVKSKTMDETGLCDGAMLSRCRQN